jgi:hypothetical protein
MALRWDAADIFATSIRAWRQDRQLFHEQM